MADELAVHSTFVIERRFAKPPSAVFAALSEPAKKRRWFGDNPNHDVLDFEVDFRVDGVERWRYRMNAKTPFPGTELTNIGIHMDIVPNRRIVIAYAMAMAGRRFSASLVTFELIPNGSGTDLILTHQGGFFEGADGPKMREEGWQSLLSRLAAEVDG